MDMLSFLYSHCECTPSHTNTSGVQWSSKSQVMWIIKNQVDLIMLL